MTRPVRYFAYGSNLHPVRLRERVPSARLVGTAVLPGWRLQFHKRGRDRSAKCDVIPAAPKGDAVHGAIFALEPEERVRLDRAEGLGRGYEERWLELPDVGPVFFYVAAATHVDDRLLPFTWYRALVVAGARFHGFPRSYIRAIAAVPSVPDPRADRRERHLRLLARLRDEASSPD